MTDCSNSAQQSDTSPGVGEPARCINLPNCYQFPAKLGPLGRDLEFPPNFPRFLQYPATLPCQLNMCNPKEKCHNTRILKITIFFWGGELETAQKNESAYKSDKKRAHFY